ncbi:MAG: aspartate kinase, partial [Clostridia bacterium]|nr:aspartate kinase [Clostridia bacterium]
MGLIVCKFGGSSLSDAAQILKCSDIVLADPARRYVVPSAPGKRFGADTKITDHLYTCHKLAMAGQAFDGELGVIQQRFDEIIAGLGLALDLSKEFAQIAADLPKFTEPDYIASRGEYLNGLIIAQLLGFEFVDAKDIVLFDSEGRFDAAATQAAASARLKPLKNAVI